MEDVFARMEGRPNPDDGEPTTKAKAKKKPRASAASDKPGKGDTTKAPKQPKPKKETKAQEKKRLAMEDQARLAAEQAAEEEATTRAALDFFASATLPRRRGQTPAISTPSRSPSPVQRLASPVQIGQNGFPTTPALPDAPSSPELISAPSPPADIDDSPFALRPPGPDRSRGPRKVPNTAQAIPLGVAHSVGARRQTHETTSTITKLSPTIAAMAGFSQIAPVDLSWEDDLISSPPLPLSALKSTPIASRPTSYQPPSVSTPVPDHSPGVPSSIIGGRRRIMGISRSKGLSTPQPLQSSASRDAMPPPPPPGGTRSSPLMSPLAATQFPVRRPGRRKVIALDSSDDTPAKLARPRDQGDEDHDDSPGSRLSRLKRRKEVSPAKRAKKSKGKPGRAIRAYVSGCGPSSFPACHMR